jgi:hypothetical protein
MRVDASLATREEEIGMGTDAHMASASRAAPAAHSGRLSGLASTVVIVLITVTLAAILTAMVMASNESIEKDTLWYEIGKLVAQAGILTGFGALITLLVHEFQQNQEESRKRVVETSQRLADRHAWLRDFASSLTDAYGDLKQSRRRLQWAQGSLDGQGFIATNVYETQLKRLSAIQTEYESLLTLAETYFSSGDPAKPIERSLRLIVDRLSALVSERKKLPPQLPAESTQILLGPREEMRGFTAESEDVDFNGPHGFLTIRDNYKKILKGIVEELRHGEGNMAVAS